jgi:hypothetical protein
MTSENPVRREGPWPLADELTTPICEFAGREASAALCIALGKRTGASAAHQAMYFEPFSYWDWHGAEDTAERHFETKRHRIWEHQRGFDVNGEWEPHEYPGSEEVWRRFKEEVEEGSEEGSIKGKWAQYIAIADWMDLSDIYW